MNNWRKILVIFGLVVLTASFVIYIFIVFQGKAIIVKQLESLTQKKVEIGAFNVKPPFNIKITDLNIEGLFKADKVFVSPSILGILTGKLKLNRLILIRPYANIEIHKDRKKDVAVSQDILNVPQPSVPNDKPDQVQAPQNKKSFDANFILKSLRVEDGKINFTDYSAGENGINILIKDIKLNLDNLYLMPVSVPTTFELSAKIPWQKGVEEGRIKLEGWINLAKKNIEATLNISDIDGIYLYPYYSQWVDLEKTRIEKAKLGFISNIQGINNNVTADCHLELTDIVRKPRSPEEGEEKAEKIADAVLDIFRALNQGKIVLDFTIRTKMDRPEFGFGSIRMAFEDKINKAREGSITPKEVLLLPARLWENAVKGVTSISKAVFDGTMAAGREIKKVVFKDSPKKE